MTNKKTFLLVASLFFLICSHKIAFAGTNEQNLVDSVSQKMMGNITLDSLFNYSRHLYLEKKYDESLALLKQMYLSGKTESNAFLHFGVTTHIGHIYRTFGSSSISRKYYEEALESCGEDWLKRSSTYQNIAATYFEEYEVENAGIAFESAMNLHLENGDTISQFYVHCLMGLGAVGLREKNYDKAEWFLNKSVTVSTGQNYPEFSAMIYNNLGDLYRNTNRSEQALEALKKSYKLKQETGANEMILLNTVMQISMVYDNLDEIDSAYYYLKHYANGKDSLNVQLSKQELLEVEKDFELRALNIEKEALKREKEIQNKVLEQKRRVQAYQWILILVIMVVAGILVYLLRKRNQDKKELLILNKNISAGNLLLQNQIREKHKISRLVFHDIKNSVAGIQKVSDMLLDKKISQMGGVSDQYLRTINESSMTILADLEQGAKTGRVGEMNDFETSELEISQLFFENIIRLRKQINPETRIEVDLPPEQIKFITNEYLFVTVIRNVISNSFKYSFHDKPVEFHLALIKNQIHFRVTNTTSLENIERLIRRFEMAEEENDIAINGVGVDLSQEIIRLMGGELEIMTTGNRVDVKMIFHYE